MESLKLLLWRLTVWLKLHLLTINLCMFALLNIKEYLINYVEFTVANFIYSDKEKKKDEKHTKTRTISSTWMHWLTLSPHRKNVGGIESVTSSLFCVPFVCSPSEDWTTAMTTGPPLPSLALCEESPFDKRHHLVAEPAQQKYKCFNPEILVAAGPLFIF